MHDSEVELYSGGKLVRTWSEVCDIRYGEDATLTFNVRGKEYTISGTFVVKVKEGEDD